MGYAYKILYNDSDITDKITAFTITCSKDNYCREMTFDTPDIAFYNTFDFTNLATEPLLEIQTKVEDTWYSQGTFYIEKPAYSINISDDIVRGVWGRSAIAVLGAPFATKITKTWESDTTFFAICEEMCDEIGYTWDSSYSEIDDYIIYKYTYQADKMYPIEIIGELASFAGAYVITDRVGNLCIKIIEFSPETEDIIITDDSIQSIDETPEFPDFGNRVRITPSGSLAGYQISTIAPNLCLKADGSSSVKVYAFVVDADGNAIQDIVITWSTDASYASLLKSSSNTQTILIQDEHQQATNINTVSVNYPVYSVLGIYAYSDKAKRTNFASGGYLIDNNIITCTDSFTYCDQALVIDYQCQGVAVNWIEAGSTAEDILVTASVEGQESSITFYVGNTCQCPATIEISASESGVDINESTDLLIYCEEGGPIKEGRKIYTAITNSIAVGRLEWLYGNLGVVEMTNQKTTAYNTIVGTTQCDLPHYIQNVSSVKLVDENGDATGDDLSLSFANKTIDLNTLVDDNTDLLVDYSIYGAAVNTYTGYHAGTDTIKAWIDSTREDKIEATLNIQVTDPSSQTSDSPSAANSAGDCVCGGTVESTSGKKDDSTPSIYEPGTSTCNGITCATGEVCKEVNGVLQCVASDDSNCVSDDVSDLPSDEKMNGRFDSALQTTTCTCETICDNEFKQYGTTQGYDGSSYRTIGRILYDDYKDLTIGTADYNSKYEELRSDAITNCTNTCDLCGNVEEIVISGEETIGRNENVLLTLTGGAGPYTWSVSGTGATLLNTEGTYANVHADETACGSITVTVQDACNNTETFGIRCTTGQWVYVGAICVLPGASGQFVSGNATDHIIEAISGKYKQRVREHIVHSWRTSIYCDSNCNALYASAVSSNPYGTMCLAFYESSRACDTALGAVSEAYSTGILGCTCYDCSGKPGKGFAQANYYTHDSLQAWEWQC